jgi:predicted TIM-barrel fold metal-dependent hydrolase
LPLIDADVAFGFWPVEKVDLSVDALQAAMRARSVAQGLAYSAKALFYDAGEGNDDTVAVCAQRPELLPVAVLDPRAYPACLEEARQRLAQGVRVFRLFPDRHGYPIDFAPAAELLEELAGQVVIVATSQIGAPTALARLLEAERAHSAREVQPGRSGSISGCCVVLELGSADLLGEALAALRRCPCLELTTRGTEAAGALEAAVAAVGAARLVFASGAPLCSLGSALMSVQFATLSEGERAAILGDNLGRLLAGHR